MHACPVRIHAYASIQGIRSGSRNKREPSTDEPVGIGDLAHSSFRCQHESSKGQALGKRLPQFRCLSWKIVSNDFMGGRRVIQVARMPTTEPSWKSAGSSTGDGAHYCTCSENTGWKSLLPKIISLWRGGFFPPDVALTR